MAGNYSNAKVKPFLIFGSIVLLSINSITILCMNDESEKIDWVIKEIQRKLNPKPKLNSYLKKN